MENSFWCFRCFRCVDEKNYLNLPTQISFANGNSIEYLYNAAGVKVEKKVHDTQNNTIKQVEYLDGFQYAGGVLQFFPTAEGYVAATKNVNGIYIYNYVYNYTDHLGNIRLSYTRDPLDMSLKIMEENHYYPFGLKHSVYADPKQMYKLDEEEELARPTFVYETEYQYKYNGKEWQDELGLGWYDYGARNYDAALGRWMNIDPLAENSRRWTPYNYAYNNPMYFIDPDGMQGTDWFKDCFGNYVYDSNLTAQNASTNLGENGENGTYLGESVTINVSQNGESVGSISLNENGSIGTSNLNIPTTTEYNISTGTEVVDANFTSGGKIYGAMEGITFNGERYNIADNFIGNAKEIYDDPIMGQINGNDKVIRILDNKLNNLESDRIELRDGANSASADGPTSGGKAASLSIFFSETQKTYRKIGQVKQKRDSLKKANDELKKK